MGEITKYNWKACCNSRPNPESIMARVWSRTNWRLDWGVPKLCTFQSRFRSAGASNTISDKIANATKNAYTDYALQNSKFHKPCARHMPTCWQEENCNYIDCLELTLLCFEDLDQRHMGSQNMGNRCVTKIHKPIKQNATKPGRTRTNQWAVTSETLAAHLTHI